MATKKISDLQLRSDFDETCQLPSDDASQTWRVTGQQMLDFILANLPGTAIASKTANHTLTADDYTILASAASGSITLSLPAAAANSGKIFVLKRTDNTPANSVTVDPNSTETIDGATTFVLATQNESLTVQSDGTNWVTLDHKCDTDWVDYTQAIGAVTTPPTPGSGAVKIQSWRRDGSDMLLRFDFSQTASGSAGSGIYLFPLPTGYVAKTSGNGAVRVTTAANGLNGTVVGRGLAGNILSAGIASAGNLGVVMYNSSNMAISFDDGGSSIAKNLIASGIYDLAGNPVYYHFTARIPIAGWVA